MLNQSVLTVCAANVCRSPAMAFLLEGAFVSSGDVQVTRSAGTAATDGVSLCRKTAGLLEEPEWAEFARAHRSTRLDLAHITDAGLILTASTIERGAVARLSPAARARTFTLIEAAALAESAVRAGLTVPFSSGLEGFASVLNAQRGVIAPAEASPWWRRRRNTNSVDIPDAHTTSEKHAVVIARVVEATDRLRAARATLAEAI